MTLNTQSVEGCPHCMRIEMAKRGQLGALLWDRKHSLAVVGDHQFFAGYAMVISKYHIREMHDLPPEVSSEIFQDVLSLGRMIDEAFKPWKINYASLGNVDEHLHWHVIPRYASESDRKEHPWKHAGSFPQCKTTLEDIQRMKDLLKL